MLLGKAGLLVMSKLCLDTTDILMLAMLSGVLGFVCMYGECGQNMDTHNNQN
jgi:hypothetical protein